MRRTPTATLLALALALLATPAPAAGLYQYAAAGKTSPGKPSTAPTTNPAATQPEGKPLTAYLWVPPNADRLRGLLVGGFATSVDPELAESPEVRKVCAEQKLGVVYLNPHVDVLFGRDGGDPQVQLQQALNALADASGHPEVAVAPVLPFGHSVSTVYASLLAATWPDRCFGAIVHKGGLVIPTPEVEANLKGVPVLSMKGQFEEFGPGKDGAIPKGENRSVGWRTLRGSVQRLRAKDDRYLVSLMIEPGATHFPWTPEYAGAAAAFIKAAAERRIPDWPADAKEPVKCNAIDPATGALARTDLENPAGPPAAPYREFKGKPADAAWYPTADLAALADALHAGMHKRPQFVAFADADGKPIPVGHDMRLNLKPAWTGPDTFKAAAVFLDAAPDKYPPAEPPVTHAEGPVKVRPYGGQIEQVAADTFRVRLDPRRRMEGNLLAYHPGDATHRYAEQGAILGLPRKLTAGKPQAITFPKIDPLKVGGSVKLAATSDSGLPVSYYVDHGPAVVEGDVLKVAEVPRRAKFPMRVVVVAYQYGSAVAPLVQSAEPVQQEVLIGE